jgi:hypothetical protein
MSKPGRIPRYVAFFDMLGMSALTLRDPDLAFDALVKLWAARRDRLGWGVSSQTRPNQIGRVTHFTFSDSIAMYTDYDRESDLRAIIVLCAELFAQALARSIPLRGGIAHGTFMVNVPANIFSGPALIEAYRLGEEAQLLGITVDDVVAQRAFAATLESSPGVPLLCKWNVPTKTGVSERSVINWPACFRKNFKVPSPISTSDFYKAFEPLFGSYKDLRQIDQAKYSNTVDFVNSQLAKLPK